MTEWQWNLPKNNRFTHTQALAAFEEKFIPEPMSGCFLWLGSINRNRGIANPARAAGWYNGKHRPASRIAWILYKGDIPEGLHVLHRCDNALCVNPDHLYLGDHAKNMKDMMDRRRHYIYTDRAAQMAILDAARPRSAVGKRGEEQYAHKLTWVQVREIRASTESSRVLGNRYGVSNTNIKNIRNNKAWKE